jgi:hypothetical protein
MVLGPDGILAGGSSDLAAAQAQVAELQSQLTQYHQQQQAAFTGAKPTHPVTARPATASGALLGPQPSVGAGMRCGCYVSVQVSQLATS